MQVCNDVNFNFLCSYLASFVSGALPTKKEVEAWLVKCMCLVVMFEHDLVAGGPQVGCREEEASAF